MEEFKTEFRAYQPQVKPISGNQGGGFSLTFDIPETEWKAIKELNDPNFKSYEFVVQLVGEKIN